MNETNVLNFVDVKVAATWTDEQLRELHHQHITYLQARIDRIRINVDRGVKGGKKACEDYLAACKEKQECYRKQRALDAKVDALHAKYEGLYAEQRAWNAEAAASNAKIEAAVKKREDLRKVVDGIEEKIREVESSRAAIDNDWKTRIAIELEKSKRSRGRPREAASRKSLTKRLNGNDDTEKRMHTRKIR